MQVSITTRHCRVPKQVRASAENRLHRLERYEPRVDNAVIAFDNDHGDKLVATRVFLAGSHAVIATGSGETYQTALDRSLDRLTRQLKRRRERVRQHRVVKPTQARASGGTTVRENADD